MPLTKVDKIFDPTLPDIVEGWKFFKAVVVNKQILMADGTKRDFDMITKNIKFAHQNYIGSPVIADTQLDTWLPAIKNTTRVASFYKEDASLKLSAPICGDENCKEIICNYKAYKSENLKSGFCFFLTLQQAEDNGEYSGLLVKCKFRGLTYAGLNGSWHNPYFALANEMFIPRDEVMLTLITAHQHNLREFVSNYGEIA